jgi:hypothetical protein
MFIVYLKQMFDALLVVAKVRFAANWAALSLPCQGQESALLGHSAFSFGMALPAPKPTFMITLTNDEVGWSAVIPELLGPRYR